MKCLIKKDRIMMGWSECILKVNLRFNPQINYKKRSLPPEADEVNNSSGFFKKTKN